jgi:hypothetical protein
MKKHLKKIMKTNEIKMKKKQYQTNNEQPWKK